MLSNTTPGGSDEPAPEGKITQFPLSATPKTAASLAPDRRFISSVCYLPHAQQRVEQRHREQFNAETQGLLTGCEDRVRTCEHERDEAKRDYEAARKESEKAPLITHIPGGGEPRTPLTVVRVILAAILSLVLMGADFGAIMGLVAETTPEAASSPLVMLGLFGPALAGMAGFKLFADLRYYEPAQRQAFEARFAPVVLAAGVLCLVCIGYRAANLHGGYGEVGSSLGTLLISAAYIGQIAGSSVTAAGALIYAEKKLFQTRAPRTLVHTQEKEAVEEALKPLKERLKDAEAKLSQAGQQLSAARSRLEVFLHDAQAELERAKLEDRVAQARAAANRGDEAAA